MRLLIVGTLKGQLTTATKIAMDNGASVTHAEDHEQAMRVLRGGKGADLLLVDVARHASRAYARESAYSEEEALRRIIDMFEAELARPTDMGSTAPRSGQGH